MTKTFLVRNKARAAWVKAESNQEAALKALYRFGVLDDVGEYQGEEFSPTRMEYSFYHRNDRDTLVCTVEVEERYEGGSPKHLIGFVGDKQRRMIEAKENV